jgi:AraC-like DNA-binding protein
MFTGDYVIIDNPNPVPTAFPSRAIGEKVDALAPLQQREELQPLRDVDVNVMYLPNVALRTMSGQLASNAVFVNKNSTGTDLVASCLFLDGSVVSTVKGEKTGVELSKGRQSIKYDPYNELMHWSKAGTKFDILHFSIAPSFLLTLLPDNEPWAEALRTQIANKKRFLTNAPEITAAQHKAVQNILNNPLHGKLGLLMLETSIIQIILLQLHAHFQRFDNMSLVAQTRRGEQLGHEIREHLDKTFLQDHSIAELASHFATNTSKLMSAFRQAIGTTIFDYIHDLKMAHAKSLLTDRGYYVAEAAREIGYKNPHHFSAAFKKKHGINPSHLRSQG